MGSRNAANKSDHANTVKPLALKPHKRIQQWQEHFDSGKENLPFFSEYWRNEERLPYSSAEPHELLTKQ